ncbi:MAG: hypothetical protein M3Q50_11850 [Chloroflexota bacterium]|nr:hypothetical protein [Chloroflexota bacterium]
MEPRPPQPRSSRPFELPGSPETAGIGERLYPTPGEQVYYPGAESGATSGATLSPLMPRRQRRQRGVLRGIAVVVVALGLLVGLGWVFRDAVRGLIMPPAAGPTAESQASAPGTPAPDPASAALPNALATVTPTVAVETTATPDSEAETEADPAAVAEATEPASRDRDISAQTLPLLDFLPTQEEIPAGFILADEAERSKEEVVTAIGGTAEAAQLLDDWGWSGNAYRDFIADESAPSPNGTTFLNFSVHRFADDESAADALVVFSDEVILAQGLQEVEAPALGESARLLVGESEGVTLTVLYAQEGPIMFRIGGSALADSGDPTADVLTVAGEIISGQAGGG